MGLDKYDHYFSGIPDGIYTVELSDFEVKDIQSLGYPIVKYDLVIVSDEGEKGAHLEHTFFLKNVTQFKFFKEHLEKAGIFLTRFSQLEELATRQQLIGQVFRIEKVTNDKYSNIYFLNYPSHQDDIPF